jgi:Complex I intermediate-associated protein 30 (CIA30)
MFHVMAKACSDPLSLEWTTNSLKNANCLRPFSSYRANFEIANGQWTTIRLSWPEFRGNGPGASENALDVSSLRRLGIVAIGKAMDATLALSSIRFVRD